jgi:predicted nucleic acid-binding protein
MVIVDTSVLIDYFGNFSNPQTDWLDRQIGLQRMAITSLVLTEVLQGIREESRFTATVSALSQFTIFEIGSRELAIQSALNYRVLRGLGATIRSTIDCLIATFCIEEGHELLHHDSDFDSFQRHLGLLVIDPSAIQRN